MSEGFGETAPPTARRPVSLALQGGGSWGAYTWGVLDALLATRGAAHARRKLRSFWMTVASPDVYCGSMFCPATLRWREALGAWLMCNLLASPYSTNPLGNNLLRAAIEAHVDVDAIRHRSAPSLYVTLTNVRTGLPRVIGNDAMTIDALVASCSLPQLFPAVEIDGEDYWDGGYAGNPTLWPLIHSGMADDLVLVQLSPTEVSDLPKDAASIRRRVLEIVFNSSLVAEMQAIMAMRSLKDNADRIRGADLRIHRIGPPKPELLERGSALERSPSWLEEVFDAGRADARRFLERNGADIGVRDTLDLAKSFADTRKPKLRVAANEETFAPLRNLSDGVCS